MRIVMVALCAMAVAAQDLPRVGTPMDGYWGIWYFNQKVETEYVYKYSGGLGTYCAKHIPMAVYAPEVNKTFFVYGGRAKEADHIVNCISFFDHATGTVPRPVALIERKTNDMHFNPTLALDGAGHVYVFANSHGTAGRSYIFRSDRPHSIDGFTVVREDNFSYSQPWPAEVEGKAGLLWLHTRYDRVGRRLFFSTTADGRTWSEPRPLVRIRNGSYQISWAGRGKVATAFDHHPEKGGLNARTNLYYLETRDAGKTWTTAAGVPVATPVTEPTTPALVRDFEKEGLLVYLKDLAFDAEGRPIVLFLTARSYRSGPESGPRTWRTARWTGAAWEFGEVTTSDHNYDHGSLYVEPDGTWRVIAPTDPGPQPHATGGAIVTWTSGDRGKTWRRLPEAIGAFNGRNQTYVRRPFNAHEGFYAYWADGDALKPSESDLYFATKEGKAFRLPREMKDDAAKPEPAAAP